MEKMATEAYKVPAEFVMEDIADAATACSPRLLTTESRTVSCAPFVSKTVLAAPPQTTQPPMKFKAVPKPMETVKTFSRVGDPPFTPYLSATPQDSWVTKRVFRDDRPEQPYAFFPPVAQGVVDTVSEFLHSTCAGLKQSQFIDYCRSLQPAAVVKRAPYVLPAAPAPAFIAQQPQPLYVVAPLQRQVVAAPTQELIWVQQPPQPRPQPARGMDWCSPAAPTVMIPNPEKQLCFGHKGDERKLCFGLLTLPPRQIKYDFVVEKTQNCLGLCQQETFVAVCRKCRMRLATCPHCHKQSVTAHP
ncbi:hypothetical protein BESB_066250 [Besnoitia besnoiti]|uniref:Uncharacterized protein n=1 Tax=Besnoitia besnoiti TaxID=94643 RepID=A0A2A9MGR5_BESBE|nr:hypothetical protein BESB_066250 [Besnoitia besnoiti]PFH34592.1 hypothetical protein BESB_066250 [Besnoitia besnoiti]